MSGDVDEEALCEAKASRRAAALRLASLPGWVKLREFEAGHYSGDAHLLRALTLFRMLLTGEAKSLMAGAKALGIHPPKGLFRQTVRLWNDPEAYGRYALLTSEEGRLSHWAKPKPSLDAIFVLPMGDDLLLHEDDTAQLDGHWYAYRETLQRLEALLADDGLALYYPAGVAITLLPEAEWCTEVLPPIPDRERVPGRSSVVLTRAMVEDLLIHLLTPHDYGMVKARELAQTSFAFLEKRLADRLRETVPLYRVTQLPHLVISESVSTEGRIRITYTLIDHHLIKMSEHRLSTAISCLARALAKHGIAPADWLSGAAAHV